MDVFLRQLIGRLRRDERHLPVRDDRAMVAFALEIGHTDRHQVVLVRHLALGVVEHLALEEAHRVVVANRALQQSLRIVWRTGRNDLETRHVGEPRLEGLRVLRRQL